jgi:hypothetical protein
VTTDRLSSDTPPLTAAADRTIASTPLQSKVKRWIAWGPGSSAALSIACFVLILASVIGFQRSGQERDMRQDGTPSAPDAVRAGQQPGGMTEAAGSAPAAVAMPVVAKASNAAARGPGPAVEATLSRARACAAAERWNCVLDAASSALSLQEGNTEAQSLLQRAIVHGGWASRTAAVTQHTANAASAAAAPVSRARTPSRKSWHSAARE